MIKTKDMKTGRDLFILYPGDYYASAIQCFIGSVTGSCVIVCLYDTIRRIGGMGFLIVPGAIGTEGIYRDQIAAQGINQMELLLGELVKLGADRKNLTAKIFGAATFRESRLSREFISTSQLRFIDQYFKSEKIPVYVDDLGGDYRRKIYFSPTDGKVYRKVLSNNDESSEFIKMELEFINRIFRNKDTFGDVILFE
ncbi:MAG: chemoreceptor glutamine deamidase CheD [Spirochaetes bacterium]|nr:chemoreceptor glutamine deamidase CheD [Spirochaetota bacterium]